MHKTYIYILFSTEMIKQIMSQIYNAYNNSNVKNILLLFKRLYNIQDKITPEILWIYMEGKVLIVCNLMRCNLQIICN